CRPLPDVASAYPWQNARTGSDPLPAHAEGSPYRPTWHSTRPPPASLARRGQNPIPVHGWHETPYSALPLYRPAASDPPCRDLPGRRNALYSPRLPGAEPVASKGWATAPPCRPILDYSGARHAATPSVFAYLSYPAYFVT